MPRSVEFDDDGRLLRIRGRWKNQAGCKSPLPVVNTVMVECNERECMEHVATLFTAKDPVSPIWNGVMLMDSHRFRVESWGKVIDARSDGASGSVLLHIDVQSKAITRVRQGDSSCKLTLE